MNTYSLKFKIILQIFLIIIFFSTLHARNLDKFNKGNYISDSNNTQPIALTILQSLQKH